MQPDDIARLATAHESALRVLELSDRDDPITEIRRIIEAAQTRLRDPDFALRDGDKRPQSSLTWKERIAASFP